MEQSQIIPKKYWQLVKLSSAGKTTIQEIALAKEFIDRKITDLKEINDKIIQTRLLNLFAGDLDNLTQDNNDRFQSQICLRCFISHQISQICTQLELQFGKQHGFNKYDLLPLVLNDTLEDLRKNKVIKSNYKPLSLKILETFESQKATLSTWTTKIVKQNRELNAFLLEQGVYLISNWAILNDTTPKQVGRILSEFHQLTPTEIRQASSLLSSYHGVYRKDRLEQRTSLKARCQTPSTNQLERISYLLEQKTKLTFSPEQILFQLQELAKLLREYRIHVRTKKVFNQQSLDDRDKNIDKLEESLIETNSNNDSEEQEFYQYYQQQLVICLHESIKQVIQNRVDFFNRKKSDKTQKFLLALQLFHCQGKSMIEIAPLIDLKAQYQVSRLLKLKEFRTDVRQSMLAKLKERILAKASQYDDSSKLQQLEAKIEDILDEQISAVIQEAEVEASIAHSTPKNLFTINLCQYLAKSP